MKAVLAVVVTLLAAGYCSGAYAQVYECVGRDGRVVFQDHACAGGQRQKLIDVPSHAPPGYVPPPVATVVVSPASVSQLPPPAPVVPPPPLPTMYECVGAVNGKPYLAAHRPGPYWAPLGVLGYPPLSLAQAYGAHGGAGASAPELARPRVAGSAIGAGLVEVSDACMPATHDQVCGFLRSEYQDNHAKLRMAMRHAQPPFARREQTLQDQLRNCR